MQNVRKIGGTLGLRKAVKGGGSSWWRATGLVQAPTVGIGKHPQLYPLQSDMREAKTDAGHRGAWLSGCGAAAVAHAHGEGRRRPRGVARVGDPHKAWSA